MEPGAAGNLGACAGPGAGNLIFLCLFLDFLSFIPHPFPCRAMTLAEPGAHSQFELQVEGAMTFAEPTEKPGGDASGKAVPNKIALHSFTHLNLTTSAVVDDKLQVLFVAI